MEVKQEEICTLGIREKTHSPEAIAQCLTIKPCVQCVVVCMYDERAGITLYTTENGLFFD